jgi:nucleotide-binding universal stress UspA family protein
MQFDRLLCPIDFSETSERAFDHAVALARWYDSRVTVIHVPALLLAPVPGEGDPLPITRNELAQRLEDFVAPARTAGVTIETGLRDGDPVREILREAEDGAANLVVIGTHGRSGFERLVLGSVAEKILRKAKCPVLTIPPGERSDAPAVQAGFKAILCATDFSPAAASALDAALRLAQEADATLTILHVVEAHFGDVAEAGASYLENLEQAARVRLASAVPAGARTWCTVVERVERGRARHVIVQVAEECEAGVIVMGAHGRHALDRLIFGSTTHRVIHEAGRPVLTLPSSGA